MVITALILLGFTASTYGTIIGAGGGFLFVPVLIMFYDISPEAAAATGLVIVFLNAAAGLPVFLKQRRVLLRTGLLLAAGAFPGTLLGERLVRFSPEAVFYALFACLLIGLGLYLILKKPPQAKDEVAATVEKSYTLNEKELNEDQTIKLPVLLGIGGMLGVISSFFGIGGGWLLVPILVYGFGLSLKAATATSIFSLALYSLSGLIPGIVNNVVDWYIVLWSGAGVLAGAQAGAILSKKMKGTTITRLLAAVVIVMGGSMIFQM
ncbi:sulfite exporter TauE/SafE family protein [Alteribacillus sp. YIM 98480]|uniref:sulfite exporter TauE/SafE family protein n=1 Tax=Alteribacillus sp. YIM 98480 TaxID=2606599 RepID=UPI00131B6082|nr:sulfite exporter TauE/SafE family protein [Alteribacillus sp. YIM 98480]